MQILGNVPELQLWCHLTLQVTESVLCSQVFSELLVLWPSAVWQPPDSGLTGHQAAEAMVLQTISSFVNLSLPCAHTIIPCGKCLTSSWNGVVMQHMVVCCHIFHSKLLFIFLILVNMVLLNVVARFVQTGCVCWFVFWF